MSDACEKLFFDSPSTTPASPRLTSKDAVELYATYMSDIHLRRLRKAKAPPPADAAGLIAGSKYSGRGTPLKGKAHAPPDQKEAKWIGTTSAVQGSSAAGTRNILTHEDVISGPVDGLMVRPHTSHGGRPLTKVQEQSYRSSLQGSGMMVAKEDPKKANSKKLGIFAPTFKTERVFGGRGAADADSAEAVDSVSIWPPSKCRAWDVQFAEATERHESEAQVQAASRKLERGATLARKHYHAASLGNQDVLRYRHSEGICPAEYKFNEVRKSTPALEVKPTGSAKDVFFDTRSSYSCNRVRGMTSTIMY